MIPRTFRHTQPKSKGKAKTPIPKRLRRNLLEQITERYSNIETFAGMAGVSKSHVYEIIKGDHYPSLRFLEKLAAALNCDIVDLLRE